MYGYTPVMSGYTPQMTQAAVSQQAVGSSGGVGLNAAAGNAANAAVPNVNVSQTGVGQFFRNGDGSFNTGNVQLALGGIQTLGALWNSYQQNRLAKESLGLQREAFETNLANQTQTYNTSLEDRIRARYATEGRSGQADGYIAEHSL